MPPAPAYSTERGERFKVQTYVSEELYQRIVEAAAEEDSSVSNIIKIAVRQYLGKRTWTQS